MSGVDLDQIKTRRDGSSRRLLKLMDDRLDTLLVEFPWNLIAFSEGQGTGTHRRPATLRWRDGCASLPGALRACLAASMGQLNPAGRVLPADKSHDPGQWLDMLV